MSALIKREEDDPDLRPIMGVDVYSSQQSRQHLDIMLGVKSGVYVCKGHPGGHCKGCVDFTLESLPGFLILESVQTMIKLDNQLNWRATLLRSTAFIDKLC